MIKHCRFCLEEFEAKRKDAQFCSESCKQKNKRGVSATSGMTPDQIRAYKKKELELNLDNLPAIGSDVPVGNPITGPGMEELTETVQEYVLKQKLENGETLSDTQEEMLKPEEECKIPTAEEAEEALQVILEYEAQFPDTTREHANFIKKSTGTECMCCHCGEKYASQGGRCALYCKYCKTKAQRDNVTTANKAVRLIEQYKKHAKKHEELWDDCPKCGKRYDI